MDLQNPQSPQQLQQLDETWQHPLRAIWLEHWKFLWANWLGGEAYIGQSYTRMMGSLRYDEAARARVHTRRARMERSMLRRHERERDERYQQRLDFATPINFLRPMTETIASAVTKMAKASTPESKADLVRDVDLCGSDLAEFRRQVAIIAIILGTDFVMEDQTRAPVPESGRPPSRADVRLAGVRPFLRHVTPIDLIHWSWDPDIRVFDWALVCEHAPLRMPPPLPDGRVDPKATQRKEPYITRLFTPDGWIRFVDGVPNGETGPRYWDEKLGGAPLVPVAINRDPSEAEPHGMPEVEDVAAIQRLVFNVHSWYVDDLFNNAFHQVILDTDEVVTGDADREFGPATWIRGKGGTMLSPNPAVFQHYVDTIAAHVALARARLGLEPNQSESPESGVALALRRENFDAFLAGLATALEGGENGWLPMLVGEPDASATPEPAEPGAEGEEGAALGEGGETEAKPDDDADGRTVYSKDFTAFNVAARLDAILNTWKTLGASLPAPAQAELMKQAVRAVTPDLDEARRKEIDDEIDTGAEEKVAKDEEMRAALLEGAAKGKDEEEKSGDDEKPGAKGGGRPGSKAPPFGGKG